MCDFIKVMWVAQSNYENHDQLFVQKSNKYILEKGQIILRPNLETFRGVWGFHDQLQNESWHKTDCRNMVSEIWLEDHRTI